MNELMLIGGMALITFTIRYALLGLSECIHLSPRLIELLRYVPPSVLTAITTPAVLMPTGELIVTSTNARLVGAIVAILVGYRTKNLLWTIALGMLAFLGWQWFFQV